MKYSLKVRPWVHTPLSPVKRTVRAGAVNDRVQKPAPRLLLTTVTSSEPPPPCRLCADPLSQTLPQTPMLFELEYCHCRDRLKEPKKTLSYLTRLAEYRLDRRDWGLRVVSVDSKVWWGRVSEDNSHTCQTARVLFLTHRHSRAFTQSSRGL